MLFGFINEFLTKLCMPSEKCIPDYKERRLTALKNKMQLIFFGVGIILFILQLQFEKGANKVFAMARIIESIIIITVLLLCCRSHFYIYHLFLAFSCACNPIMITLSGEPIAGLGAGFMTNAVLFTVTNKWYYNILAFIGQLINYEFFLRESLETTIINMGAKAFCRRIIEINTGELIVLLLFACPLQIATNKLTQELKESKVEAENSLSHYKTFLFSFSHEIRNPINILLGSLEMALVDGLPASALQMVETAKISGELLLQLINNVLDVGKAEVGKLEIVPTPTRIHELLIRMWSLCSELIKKKGLCGYLKISINLPRTLELDADRLNQVLLNLLGNAIKFTQKGAVNLTVEWLAYYQEVLDESFEPLPFNLEEEGVFDKNECFSTLGYSTGSTPGRLNNFYTLTHSQKKTSVNLNKIDSLHRFETYQEQKGILKIIVRDQGCGMSQEAMKGLFKKFYQCNPEASQRKRGTGLGLYITKDICESMGGEIRVYSEENKGTVFIACIPCKRLIDRF